MVDIYNLTHSFATQEDDSPHSQPLENVTEALRRASKQTVQLLAAFIQLAPVTSSITSDAKDFRKQASSYRDEAMATRSEAKMLRTKLAETENELQDTRDRLVVARNQVNRVRSETVHIMQLRVGGKTGEVPSEKDEKKGFLKEESMPPVNGHSSSVRYQTSEVQSVADSSTQTNGMSSPELGREEEQWKALATSREGKIEEISKELTDAMCELTALKQEVSLFALPVATCLFIPTNDS